MLGKVHVERHDRPYPWAHLRGVLPAQFADQLARDFPFSELREFSAFSHPRQRLQGCTFVDANKFTGAAQRTSVPWRRMLALLLSDEYRNFVAQISGKDLSRCEVKVRACVYAPRNFIMAHTDNADRVVSQIFYLNRGWVPEWGGQLDILTRPDDHDPRAVAARLWPDFNTAVLLVRSDHSYHAVRPVTTDAACVRRSVVCQFVRGS